MRSGSLAVDENICEVFGALSARLRAVGGSIGDFDELIASITLCNDAVIITRDRHFKSVPGLKVEEY